MNLQSYNYFYFLLHPCIATYYDKSLSNNASKFNPALIKDVDKDKKNLFDRIFKFYNINKNTNDKEL